ncbi:MAG: peptidyl-prolyl cis-trans isomerase [Alphaproteobacteria bacterium]
MNLLMRLLREPLVHFLAIGGLIFLVFVAVSDTGEAPADVIVITPERIDQLVVGFSSVWKRMPTDDELDALIDEEVREEVYYRGALALGLDRNDTIVRRRMRQKMEFLLDTGAYIQDPAAGELEAYFTTKEDFYRSGPRLAFEQIYFGEAPAAEAIALSLRALRSDPPADPATLGERTLLPAQLGLSPPTAIDGVFGKNFFELLAELPLGGWTGPVVSSYGVHLVRILDSLAARTPPLEEVRDAVLRDWRAAKAQEIRERDYAERRKRFVVEIRRRDARAAESQ